MANKLVGYYGDVKIGLVSMKVTEWSCNQSAEEIDITSKADVGAYNAQLGLKGLEGSFKAVWDTTVPSANVPPFATVKPQEGVSFNLAIGNQGAVTGDGESNLTFTGIITSLEITSAVAGAIEYTCSFKASGAVTHNLI